MKRCIGGFIYGLVLAATLAIAADVKWSAFPDYSPVGGAITQVGIQDGINIKVHDVTYTGTSLTSSASVMFGSFTPTMPALTSLNFNFLTLIFGDFAPSMDALTSLNLSSLILVAGTFQPSMAALPSLSLPALTDIGFTQITMTVLTSLSLPALKNIAGAAIFNTPALTTLTINSGLLSVSGNVIFNACALNQASVDGLLVRLAALNGTGGTTSYDGHTVTIGGTSATPSATGLAAKATLEGRGNTVTVN